MVRRRKSRPVHATLNSAGWLAVIAAAFVLAIVADRVGALICWLWGADCG